MKALSFRARRRNEAYKVVQVIGKQDFLVITPNVKKRDHSVSFELFICTGLTTQG